ncbi:HPr kinase/phosphorylase [Gluconobacter thailandicus]|jgi:HPr kinase/phosphorylase|uniref:Serine kinase n=1 Tax=Gluconobacter thailandicus TaxID=257438 RepID=A0AAP9ES44_GLUTH|nr:HPr kinase/phosphatase C-terminal domain-containing protein [Gluconobacter thailandicus]QEH95592.1 serine kinase [Gluconobacter thailandicus]GAN90321.1 phospho-carrier protein HPr kinase [Gluconobacter frateurii M-2]
MIRIPDLSSEVSNPSPDKGADGDAAQSVAQGSKPELEGSQSVSSRQRFPDTENFHASCVARDGKAILLCGPSGAGKSILALQLIEAGFSLVSDDRVVMRGEYVSPPAALAGLLEVRGVGILRTSFVTNARVILKVFLGDAGARLPAPERDKETGAVVLHLNGSFPGDLCRIVAAFRACCGAYEWHAGAGGDVPGL